MEGGPKAELEDGLQEGSNSDEAGMMTPVFPSRSMLAMWMIPATPTTPGWKQ